MNSDDFVKKMMKKKASRKFIEAEIGESKMAEIKKQKRDEAKANKAYREASKYEI